MLLLEVCIMSPRPFDPRCTEAAAREWLLAHPADPAGACIAGLAPDLQGIERRRAHDAIARWRRMMVAEGLIKPLPSGRQRSVMPPSQPPPPDAIERDLLALSPAESIAWTIKRLRRTLDEADPGSAAYVTAAGQMQKCLDRYHELRRAEEKPAPGPADLSPAEWREQLGASARELVDVDLEVYVAEWLGRKRLRLVARSDGALGLERA
jgi:hypothetical protein